MDTVTTPQKPNAAYLFAGYDVFDLWKIEKTKITRIDRDIICITPNLIQGLTEEFARKNEGKYFVMHSKKFLKLKNVDLQSIPHIAEIFTEDTVKDYVDNRHDDPDEFQSELSLLFNF